MSKGGDSGFSAADDPNESWAYAPPMLAAQAPVFEGYGYEAPSMQMVQAPSQLPQMSMDPNAIMDPSVMAALEILNRPQMMAQMPQMLGSGTQYQEAYGLLPSITPKVRPTAPAKKKSSIFDVHFSDSSGSSGSSDLLNLFNFSRSGEA
jgi:hypothetical protein